MSAHLSGRIPLRAPPRLSAFGGAEREWGCHWIPPTFIFSGSSLSIAAPSHWIPFVPSIGPTSALGRRGPDSRSDVSMESAFKPSAEGSLEGFSSLSVCSRVSRSAQNAQSVQRLIEMFVKQKAGTGRGRTSLNAAIHLRLNEFRALSGRNGGS